MAKQEELDRLWRMIQQKDSEIEEEVLECRKRQTRTPRYLTLQRDMQKLKDEYEKVKGGGTYDSMSLKHGETMTTRTVMGDALGRTGPETHRKLED